MERGVPFKLHSHSWLCAFLNLRGAISFHRSKNAHAFGCAPNASAQKPHIQEWLYYMPIPMVRYNEMRLREIWRIPLQLRLMLHLRRLPRRFERRKRLARRPQGGPGSLEVSEEKISPVPPPYFPRGENRTIQHPPIITDQAHACAQSKIATTDPRAI